MDTILLSIILLVGLIILYFQIRNKPKEDVNNDDDDPDPGSPISSFGITEDMDRKVS